MTVLLSTWEPLADEVRTQLVSLRDTSPTCSWNLHSKGQRRALRSPGVLAGSGVLENIEHSTVRIWC